MESAAMSLRRIALAPVVVGILLASVAASAEAPVAAPVDQEVRIAGVEVACTGFGRAMREDPKWGHYGVRLEFSNARNEYLSGALVTVRTAAGRPVLSATCDAPWLLMRLSPGAYRVEARLTGAEAKPRSATFKSPATGQIRVVLQFPDAP
jgi:hypothetical protein